MTLAPDRPHMFSVVNPALQVAWDATSMSALLKCGRYYDLTINHGWRKSSVHLEFGGFLADGLETFQKARLNGDDIDTAILAGLRCVLEASWEANEDGIDSAPSQWGG